VLPEASARGHPGRSGFDCSKVPRILCGYPATVPLRAGRPRSILFGQRALKLRPNAMMDDYYIGIIAFIMITVGAVVLVVTRILQDSSKLEKEYKDRAVKCILRVTVAVFVIVGVLIWVMRVIKK
jgi:hypothetical protein